MPGLEPPCLGSTKVYVTLGSGAFSGPQGPTDRSRRSRAVGSCQSSVMSAAAAWSVERSRRQGTPRRELATRRAGHGEMGVTRVRGDGQGIEDVRVHRMYRV